MVSKHGNDDSLRPSPCDNDRHLSIVLLRLSTDVNDMIVLAADVLADERKGCLRACGLTKFMIVCHV